MPTKKQNPTFRSLPIQIKLGEIDGKVDLPKKVQLLKVGTFHHAEYGKFEIKPETLVKLKENFDKKVRGIDLAIDFAHESEKEAAAWIKSLLIEGETLWAEVDWTAAGSSKVGGKEFRYLSADFSKNFQNNETLEAFGPTLLGAGLTNRPVIKGMAPVLELSEFNQKKEPLMDEKDKKIAELEALIAELKKKGESDGVAMADMQKKLGEFDLASKKSAEEKGLAEKKGRFDKLLSEGKCVEAQREPFMKDDFTKFSELAQPLKLSELGHGKDLAAKKTDGKSAEDEILELAEKKAKEDKIPVDRAISLILSSNKELNERYQKEVG